MSAALRKVLTRAIEAENAKWPWHLVQMPPKTWPSSVRDMRNKPTVVWRSKDYLVQVFDDGHPGILRLSVTVASIGSERFFKDGIPWDELQRLKSQAGYGDCDAVEIYPRDEDVVNVANMRHLFVYTGETIPFAWRRNRAAKGGATD